MHCNDYYRFWPPVGTLHPQLHFATLTHSVFQSRGAATAIVTKIIIVSRKNVSVRVVVDEDAGVVMSEQGRAPYPRVGQTLSQIGREVLLFGGLAPYSTYFYNSTWFAQFGSGFGLSETVSWRVLHPEDSLSSPMALHSGAAVASQSSPTIPAAFWHVGGASLTYEPSAALWMYLLSDKSTTLPQPRFVPRGDDPASTLSNRWYRRALRYSQGMALSCFFVNLELMLFSCRPLDLGLLSSPLTWACRKNCTFLTYFST